MSIYSYRLRASVTSVFDPIDKILFGESLQILALVALGSCHVTSSRQGMYENWRVLRSLEHILGSF